jgi:hypothetical protein
LDSKKKKKKEPALSLLIMANALFQPGAVSFIKKRIMSLHHYGNLYEARSVTGNLLLFIKPASDVIWFACVRVV